MAISAQRYRIIHDLMLHEAACAGDDFRLATNINYVKRGKMDINFKDDEYGDRTPLHCSAGEGKPLNSFPTNFEMFIHCIGLFLAHSWGAVVCLVMRAPCPHSFPQFRSKTPYNESEIWAEYFCIQGGLWFVIHCQMNVDKLSLYFPKV